MSISPAVPVGAGRVMVEQNAVTEITRRLRAGKISRAAAWLALPLRTVSFALVQVLLAGILALTGAETPWRTAIFWWPVSVIITNLVTLAALIGLTRAEGLRLNDLWGFSRARIKQDLITLLVLVVVGVPFGGLGFVGGAMLLYGGQIPEYVGALPMWAALVCLVVTPASIALVELPLYLGYCLPRLEAITGRRWLAFALVTFFLTVQHCTLPLQFDARFIAYRFVSMLPVAIFVGLAYLRIRRLSALMLMHYLLDLNVGITVLMFSLNP